MQLYSVLTMCNIATYFVNLLITEVGLINFQILATVANIMIINFILLHNFIVIKRA